MKATIIGIVRGTSKNGRAFMQIHAVKDFTEYEQQNSDVVGQACFSEFTYNDFNLKPGDVVDFSYEPGFQGRATLVDVIPLKLAEQSNAPKK